MSTVAAAAFALAIPLTHSLTHSLPHSLPPHAAGMNVFQQFQAAKLPIVRRSFLRLSFSRQHLADVLLQILTFFVLTVATAVPVLKGVPRKGNGFWSADAELINGRYASMPAICGRSEAQAD